MGDDDYYTVLQQEFAAEEGSFLHQLHYVVWDKAAFTRVTNAMLACCQAYDEGNQPPTLFGQAYDTTRLPRWLTDVFWEVATVLAGPIRHPTWKEMIAADPDYYDRANERLRDLANWFFSGRCGYKDPAKHFAPM
jgi:hypothetical protein